MPRALSALGGGVSAAQLWGDEGGLHVIESPGAAVCASSDLCLENVVLETSKWL